ncbi:MAG TPA: hypothetical protein VHD56_11660 [Tepidisphaeraceae bacterium]|nr:hypothetical protein [Tepidisphaeraceae bacterium]
MTGRLVRQIDLVSAERDAMFALLDAHFEGVTRDQFDRDLREKNWVVLIEEAKQLFGFSTILAYQATVAKERINVICSGDTIVSPAAWGSMAFPRTWIRSVYGLREAYPDGRLIWLLLTSGFRTYRLLPVFWSEFYPRAAAVTPPAWHRMLSDLASQRFGPQFCPERGIVRFENPQRLRPQFSVVPEGRRDDPDVEFFIQQNPGFVQGDELVCIADLSPENLTPAGRRVVNGACR